MFLFGTYEGYQQRLAVSSASIVLGTAARKGLMPDGSSKAGDAEVRQRHVAGAQYSRPSRWNRYRLRESEEFSRGKFWPCAL